MDPHGSGLKMKQEMIDDAHKYKLGLKREKCFTLLGENVTDNA